MNIYLQILPWAIAVAALAAFFAVSRRHLKLIGERNSANEALRAAGIKLTRVGQAIESATDAIGIGDFEGHSLYHNAAHVALFGYTVEELNAVPEKGVLFADKEVGGEIHRSISAGRSWVGETDILTKDGRRIPAYVRADIIRDETGTPVGIFGVFRDVTRERLRADEEARAGKLETLGMMAGGISHDFNNLLTVIMGNMSLAQVDPDISEKGRDYLGNAERAAVRASEVARQLTQFAKGDTPKKARLELEPVLRESVNFAVQNSIVRLDYGTPSGLWSVEADEAQLVQVFNNLALNAVQAMPAGGTLTVRVDNHTPPSDAPLPPRAGRWIRVVLADTGIGIPPENLARIFEPFFTTKQKGTGLGLATCYSVIKRHGGFLRVESEVGKGTSFHVLLPASADLPCANRSNPTGSGSEICNCPR